ncbi:hypothetical protein PV08_10143 [Exophiala spinifera]|uniref:Uncharacterized protein n=1 Tax=Exophiala spinifera TaxID=91928 RepID=A0A0D2BHK0_9EURO|nr:uncharacterized protein PV08_10143 [Exophiala spinifera]KIW10844.1 hypothetical protein PV08_10143 [Exophiala spinifera]
MADNSDTKINMTDNSENTPPPQTDGQQNEGSGEGQGQDKGSWYSKPESLGNSAGDKIEGALSPVGKHAGPVLEKVGGPVGGLVDPTVGGIMRAGKGWGDQIGVGFGNEGGGPAKQQQAEEENLKKGLGGNEQNADNPLGL